MIENTNGILRRNMPRKTDITNYTARDISDITLAVNSTPRKCLGYKTPAETFLENLKNLTLVLDGSPEVICFAVDADENFVQMPAPLYLSAH